MMRTFIIVLLLIIINIFTVYRLLFNLFFNDKEDLKESMRFMATPDILSLFRGEYMKDRIAETKLGLFVVLCIMITVAEYSIINELILKIIN